MAKEIPSVDFFEVRLKVHVVDFGPFMVDLQKRHTTVEVIDQQLRTDNLTFKGKQNREVKALDFLMAWISEHPTFRANELIKYFRADGRTDGAGYSALRDAVEAGHLKKLGAGQYSRADVKAIAGPRKKAKTTKVKHDIGGGDFALRLMSRNHGRMSSATMKGHFEKDGRSPTGVGPVLNKLLEDKRIKRVGEGLYELTPKKTNPSGNGITPPAVKLEGEGVANG